MRGRADAIALVVALTCRVGAQAPADPSRLKQLTDEHRIFELRDAVDGRAAPAFYKGVVAAAFGRFDEGEALLTQTIREATDVTVANEAREALIGQYLVVGRSSDAVTLIDQILKNTPSRADMRGVRGFLARFGNQRIESRKPAEIACSANRDGIVLPLTVNGKAVRWLLDTGFSNAALSESEARMIGLAIKDGGTTQDFQGGIAAARTAVADRVVIGGTVLRNMPVIVYPDSQPPWNELPPGQRGALGLPVAVALQSIGWTTSSACQVGATTSAGASIPPNLAFVSATLIARAQFGDRPLDFVVDTGNQGGTQLWARFAQEFPALVRDTGRKTTKTVQQIGGVKQQDIVALPEAHLAIGSFDAVIRPAEIFGPSVGDGAHHGNLGMDVLAQARAVTIDFQAMRLTMH